MLSSHKEVNKHLCTFETTVKTLVPWFLATKSYEKKYRQARWSQNTNNTTQQNNYNKRFIIQHTKLLCPWGNFARNLQRMCDRNMRSRTEFAQEIQLTDYHLTSFLHLIYLINLDKYSPAIPTLRHQKNNLNCLRKPV